MASQELLTRTLVELADSLVDDFDVVELLTLLTDRCREAFDVDAAGLMLAAPIGGPLQVMASSSAAMRDLELYELQSSEGPCLDCYHSGEPVTNESLDTTADRWPRFTSAAIAAGFASVSAIPMRLRGHTIGALNIFRSGPGVLSDADLSAVRAFADVATIAILQHQSTVDAQTLNEQLNGALNSRIIIEQAKGMLAERAGIDVDEAFVRLRHHARTHNLRLASVAQDLIHSNLDFTTIEPPPAPTS